MILGILCLAYVLSKITTNQNPEMNEDEEHARNEGAVKHQGWQTLDWTEPWSRR